MPSKSRNSSRKSTASSQGKPIIKMTEDEIPSILVVSKPSSRKTTPKSKSVSTSQTSPRPDFLEPLVSPTTPPLAPPPTPWDYLGMPEAEFHAMMTRVKAMYQEIDREKIKRYLEEELDDPAYWNMRIDQLEKEREFFNKKRGWSAADIVCVERIDREILECEEELDRIYGEEDRLEMEYD